MSRFQLIVFDLDGTLVDSRRDLADAANGVLAEFGCPPFPEETIGRMVGDGAATLVRRVFDAAGRPQPADALTRFLAIYGKRLLTCTRPYEGVPAALDALGARATLAVLTNKPLAATRAILDGLGLARHFAPELVYGGDAPFPRKPDPAGLRALVSATGTSPTGAVLVGDSLVDWQTAHAAGIPICAVRYGFGFDSFPIDALGPDDRVATAPSDLPILL